MKTWHALHVKHQCESIVIAALDPDVETFWPHREEKDSRNRKVRRPWFPGYLFARFNWSDPQERIRILRIQNVIAILGTGTEPAAIPEVEIESLRILMHSRVGVEPHPYIEIGEQVRVVRGPLAGVEGRVLRFKSTASRLIVSVDLLGQSVVAELDPDTIEAVARRSLQPRAA